MTNIVDLLGITLPIIQAPMAGVQDNALALAVARAGGLGSIPCGMLSDDVLVNSLTALQAATSQGINLNFFCHQVTEPDPAIEQRWRSRLAGYFSQYGHSVDDIVPGQGRHPFSHHIADLIEPFKPQVLSFHFGLPEPSLLQRVKTWRQAWGCRLMACATTLPEALWLEAQGVDVIIAQGVEAGGHRGIFLADDITAALSSQVSTLSLLAQIIAKVTVPVVAAGGIANAAGVQAVLTQGAIAAQIGTAYLLCDEVKTSALYRAALTSDNAHTTVLTNVFSGRPARGIVNRAITELGPINADVPAYPQAAVAIGALRQLAEAQGSADFTPLWCGQNTTGCQAISAYDLTLQLGC